MAITYNNLYLDIRQQLRKAGIEAATLEARELVCFGTGKSREELTRDGGLYASPELERQVRSLVHLLLLPLVVGVTYEFNRWVGRHVQEGGLAKVLTAPGMWMQNFTTNEPDDGMIECAIRSLELVLPSEKGKDEW